MSLRDDRAEAHLNPDCRDGKHNACRGDAWSVSADAPIDCACSCHRPALPTVNVYRNPNAGDLGEMDWCVAIGEHEPVAMFTERAYAVASVAPIMATLSVLPYAVKVADP